MENDEFVKNFVKIFVIEKIKQVKVFFCLSVLVRFDIRNINV